MFVNLYIPRQYNDMKLAVQKYLVDQILYRKWAGLKNGVKYCLTPFPTGDHIWHH